jgi:peptide/nickel transport system substrate-binding protein
VCDANRVLLGIIYRYPSDVPLQDKRVRKAMNLAVVRQKVITMGLAGYANPLCALTASWCGGFSAGMQPYTHDPEQARRLLHEVSWPAGRNLRIAVPEPFGGIAQLVSADMQSALDIGVDVIVVPQEKLLAGTRMLVEKKLIPSWDILVFGWFDLSSEAPPAAIHREFFGSDGAFRAGPELPEFNKLYEEMAAQIDGQKLVKVAEQIDRYAYDEALALFLCAPQALYAVNKHVNFGPYRTTFELAETEVDEKHWSRRGIRESSQATQATQTSGKEGSDSFTSGSSGNAC